MSPEVFLREDQKLKKVVITDANKPKISNEFIKKWQNIANVTAGLIGVTAALIMKITPDSMEVLVSNENIDNPYNPGDCDSLGQGLYCETVIGKNNKLYIKNALKNDVWKDNPDIDLNMIS